MQKVEAAKTEKQRLQIETHLLERGQIYLDLWKIGVNTALRISDLLALTMKTVTHLDPDNPIIHITEQKTGKLRKIAINKPALLVMQRRLNDHPQHVWLFQSDALNLHKHKPPQAINRRSVARVFGQVGQNITPNIALGTHSMRKTRGYAMYQAGRSIESIAKVLNHASPSVTMRYIGLVQQDIDESCTEFEL